MSDTSSDDGTPNLQQKINSEVRILQGLQQQAQANEEAWRDVLKHRAQGHEEQKSQDAYTHKLSVKSRSLGYAIAEQANKIRTLQGRPGFEYAKTMNVMRDLEERGGDYNTVWDYPIGKIAFPREGPEYQRSRPTSSRPAIKRYIPPMRSQFHHSQSPNSKRCSLSQPRDPRTGRFVSARIRASRYY